MATEFTERARRLRNAVEPLAAGVYFAPDPQRIAGVYNVGAGRHFGAGPTVDTTAHALSALSENPVGWLPRTP